MEVSTAFEVYIIVISPSLEISYYTQIKSLVIQLRLRIFPIILRM